MAKITQEARVDVTLNGEAAKNEIKTMKEQLEKFTAELERLQKTPVGAMKPGEVQKMGELRKETQKLEKQIKSAEEKSEAFARTLKNINSSSLKDLQAAARRLSYEVKELAPGTQEFIDKSKQLQQVNTRIVQLRTSFKGLVVEQENSVGFFKRLAGNLSNYFGAIMIGYQAVKRLAQGFMEAYKTISNFEQANANLASILGATSEQMEKLEKAAIALGSSTRYTATQVTSLQTELAKLGFTTKEIVDMAPSVLQFAGSVGTDLASAAAMAGVALRSFNLRSDQTEDALGTMAVACNKSALSFTYLQNSFSTIAPVAKTYGLSLKDTIALLGTLANAGFDASSAATATRNILLNLSDTNGKLAKALGGSVHSFEDIMAAMKKLRDQGVDLNETLSLTDKRSVAAFNTFLDGAESAQTLRGELEDVNGELQRMAEQRAATVEGAIDGMKSAWEGFVLTFRSSKGFIKNVLDSMTVSIRGITRAMDPESAAVNDVQKWFANAKKGSQDAAESAERLQAKFDQLMQTYSKVGGKTGEMYRNAIKEVFDEEMAAVEADAAAINEKVQQVNAEYLQKEQEIYRKRAELLENNSNAAGTKAWKQLEDQLAANKKAWDKALDDARNFRDEMDDIVNDTGGGGEVDEKELAKRQQAYNKKKAQMEAYLNYEEKRLKVAWLKGEMGEADYNSAVYTAKAQYYKDLLELARQYGQDDTAIRNKMLDDHIKALEDEKKRVKQEIDEMAKYYAGLQTEDEARFLNKSDNGIADQEAYDAFQEKIWQKAADIRAAITEDSARQEYETKVRWAEKLAEQEKITAEEAQKYILQAKLEYAQKAAEQVNSIAEQASNFVTALKEAESAQLEAEYQKQLTDAGDNAEERERIEAEHEQKKLDLQKKYADVEMVINIAKTVANGAGAAIRAWLDAGPYAGPILAALIAATTAAEVATIVAQRNTIKNSSVNSTGSSSSVKTGTRTVTGYSEGGNTKRAASDATVVGVVHANEWVAPAWMVRQNPVTFANLERYRQQGSRGRSGNASRGFADGGFTTKGNAPATSMADSSAAIEEAVRKGIRAALEGEWVRAYIVRRDLTEMDAQDARFKSQTSRS